VQSLKQRIIKHITETGPMNIAAYMGWCLLDPTQGYYPTRDPLGVDGDFITAPEISQMFGELLGLWLLQSWRSMGSPERVQIVEYGPGRGVMMADMMRTARLEAGFFKAIQVVLIETSSALEAKQAEQLANCGVPVQWATNLSEVEPGPTLVIGNEFLDCLPIRQFIMKDRFKGPAGWHERMIDVHPDNLGKLIYTVAEAGISKIDQDLLPSDIPEAKDGDLIEVSPGLAQIADTLGHRFAAHPGAALFIDYGPEETEFGDSFQALHKHKKVFPLDAPGEADQTARVDFAALAEEADRAGLKTYGPSPQGPFLSRLGIEVRAVALSKSVPDAKEKIARQLHRLTNSDEMGTLFKAIAIQSPALPAPLGFGSE
jgi:NADH dehydrogenase [ubiquinone] 1 alpha subcomplex assembly factor 7